MPTYTYTTLDDTSGQGQTFAYGINLRGVIVGFYTDADGTHGFLRILGEGEQGD